MTTIPVTLNVPLQRVLDIVINALDTGACNYWCSWEATEFPGNSVPDVDAIAALGWVADPQEWVKTRKDYFAPFMGGALRFSEDDPISRPLRTLDLAAIQRGLDIMASTHARHFADLVNENDDIETADVFMQCCMLGEVIYG